MEKNLILAMFDRVFSTNLWLKYIWNEYKGQEQDS